MTHSAAHDPTRDHQTCGVCEVGLRRAFNRLADLPLGPAGADALIRKLRELAEDDIHRAEQDFEDVHTAARLEDLRRFVDEWAGSPEAWQR